MKSLVACITAVILRYVLDPQLLRPLQARGWIDEGIVFCVPPAAM